jgi:hypothetical protein
MGDGWGTKGCSPPETPKIVHSSALSSITSRSGEKSVSLVKLSSEGCSELRDKIGYTTNQDPTTESRHNQNF